MKPASILYQMSSSDSQPALIPNFKKLGGLIPVITQDYSSGDVLMLGWMNLAAWNATLERRKAVYWSRTHQKLWEKGELSDRTQLVKEILLDCDLDTVLLKVEQLGDAACHTGRRSCFYQRITRHSVEIVSEPLFDPKDVYD